MTQPANAEREPRERQTIEIRGIWLVTEPGPSIRVLVELPDGTYRQTHSEPYDPRLGPVSHYVHPAGIRSAPTHPGYQS